MLHQENKITIYCFILGIIFFTSCNKYTEYNEKEVKKIRERTKDITYKYLGESEYWKIYKEANDSILNWQKHQLGLWKYYGYDNGVDYQIDSVFCVNTQKDKIFFSILRRNLPEEGKEGKLDSIWHFYGVKINNQWYFFDGPALLLPREFYQEDIHTPLSFEKLKQIATMHFYRNYLKKGKKGKWEINERLFSDLTSVAWCTNCVTQEDWDSTYLSIIRKKWKGKDTESSVIDE